MCEPAPCVSQCAEPPQADRRALAPSHTLAQARRCARKHTGYDRGSAARVSGTHVSKRAFDGQCCRRGYGRFISSHQRYGDMSRMWCKRSGLGLVETGWLRNGTLKWDSYFRSSRELCRVSSADRVPLFLVSSSAIGPAICHDQRMCIIGLMERFTKGRLKVIPRVRTSLLPENYRGARMLEDDNKIVVCGTFAPSTALYTTLPSC